MLNNSLQIDFKLSKSKINHYFQEIYNQYHGHKLQTEGLNITINHIPNDSIQVNARGKAVLIDILIAFNINKSAGLFSVEGEGKLLAHVELNFDINSQFHLNIKSNLLSYDWKYPPVVNLGELKIPAETIANCIIHFLKVDLMKKLDDNIRDKVDLKQLINNQMAQFATNYPVNQKPALYFNGEILNVVSDVFSDDTDNINLNLWIEMLGKIADCVSPFTLKQTPTFFWMDEKPSALGQSIEVEWSYDGLSKMILNEINGKEIGGKKFDIDSLHIRKSRMLEIKANLISPIKSILTIIIQPKLDIALQKIQVEIIKIDVDAANIIYKLSSPLIEKIIRSRLEELLPLDPAPFILPLITKLSPFKLMDNKVLVLPSVDGIFIEDLNFKENNLQIIVNLQNTKIEVLV